MMSAMAIASVLVSAIGLVMELVMAIALALVRAARLSVAQSAVSQQPRQIVSAGWKLEYLQLIPVPTSRRPSLRYRKRSVNVFDPVPELPAPQISRGPFCRYSC